MAYLVPIVPNFCLLQLGAMLLVVVVVMVVMLVLVAMQIEQQVALVVCVEWILVPVCYAWYEPLSKN
jgi:hypothetical protein